MAQPSTCASCAEPLLLQIDLESDSEYGSLPTTPFSIQQNKQRQQSASTSNNEPVLDDVELTACGCHFHWECFLESYSSTQCPNCAKPISTKSQQGVGEEQILCTVRNEGGVQREFDILPSVTEEAYLRSHPEEMVGRAFLEFCREGDGDAVVCLVRDEMVASTAGLEGGEREEVVDVLRYVGQFEGADGSGLHVAIRNGQEGVAWLLLGLASGLEWERFPAGVLQEMKGFGLEKSDRVQGVDVRTLKDSEGRTAEELAGQVGGLWGKWLKDGRLRA